MNRPTFTKMILESEKSLYHVAKPILQNDEDCADALQETILIAYGKLKTLKNEAFFKTWLTRILINECYRILRTNKKLISYEDYLDVGESYTQESYSELYDAISKLDCKVKIPIILFYIEGFSIKEICDILKISESSVKTRLYRGRKILKEKLGGAYDYE